MKNDSVILDAVQVAAAQRAAEREEGFTAYIRDLRVWREVVGDMPRAGIPF